MPARPGRLSGRAPEGVGPPIDVLIVSLGSTAGLRKADEELHDSLERAGAHVKIVTACAPSRKRTLMLTDLGWALAARAALANALAGMSRRAAASDRVLEYHRRAALAAPGRGPL